MFMIEGQNWKEPQRWSGPRSHFLSKESEASEVINYTQGKELGKLWGTFVQG